MGTERRERQKEHHREHQQSVRAELKRQQRRRTLFTAVGAAAILGVIGVAGWALVSSDDTTTDSASDTTLDPTEVTPPIDPGAESPVSDAPCPPDDGTPERVTTFDGRPQMCIDPAATYQAQIATSKGDFTVALDAAAAPETVNNFVVLARSHFYDGIPFHRIVPGFVIQAGDPTETDDLASMGSGGPGYTIAEEPPADGVYAKYDLAMAKTQQPNSTGSQFFVVTGDPAPLNSSPTYSLFGTVTEGTEVVDALGAAPVAGPNGDTPTETITIDSVTITEQ
ncbi:MAG: peptidylprolyl isomerase [Microthrixaceae bacterium]